MLCRLLLLSFFLHISAKKTLWRMELMSTLIAIINVMEIGFEKGKLERWYFRAKKNAKN